MGIFGKKKSEISDVQAPVASTGKINGLTKDKGRGFILETSTNESLFFNSESCADFDQLAMGEMVNFKKEPDPKDRLRMHAIEVRKA